MRRKRNFRWIRANGGQLSKALGLNEVKIETLKAHIDGQLQEPKTGEIDSIEFIMRENAKHEQLEMLAR